MFKSTRITLFIVAFIAALGLFVGVGSAQAAGLTVNPAYGNYTTTFTVKSTGFTANENVNTWVTLADGSTVGLGSTKASKAGAIEFDITPGSSWKQGEVIAVAQGAQSKHQYSAKFQLVKQDGAAPADATTTNGAVVPAADLTVTYSGGGYIPGEPVATWFNYPSEATTNVAHALPNVTADASGNVSFNFSVQKDWEFGQYHISAEGLQSKHITFNTFSFFNKVSDLQTYAASSSGNILTGDWTGSYYNNTDLSGDPVLTRTDANINFFWGNGSPDPSVNADNFSVRWTSDRNVNADQAGNYTITATTDDGMRIWVDGNLVLDQWFDQTPTTYTTTIYLGEGSHHFRVEYYEHTANAEAVVQITR